MYQPSVRSATAGTAKTFLALVAILSLLLSALAVARPVVATENQPATEHCENHQNVYKHEVDTPIGEDADAGGSDGSFSAVIGDVTVYYTISGGTTVNFYANSAHTIPMTVDYCTKGSTDANDGSGTGFTLDNLSYFVIYKAYPPAPVCPPGELALEDFWYTVNGGATTYDDLDDIPNLPGSVLTVHFTIADGCEDIELSLDSNEASGPTWSNSRPQTDFDHDTGFFDAGQGSLTADIPDCYYQVDFVFGPLLTAEQLNNDTLYGDRKIDWRNGGDGPCGGVEPEEDGTLQLHKLYCEGTNDPNPEFDVREPRELQIAETEPEGCSGGNADFTIKLGEEVVWQDDLDNDSADDPTDVEHIALAAEEGGTTYTLIEDSTGGSTTFTVYPGETTTVIVKNYEPDQGEGQIKVLKYYCDSAAEESVAFVFSSEQLPDCDAWSEGDEEATFQLWVMDGDTFVEYGDPFTTVNGQASGIVVDAPGTYKLEETDPLSGASEAFDVVEYDPENKDQTIRTIWVFNTPGEVQPQTGSITIDKQLDCEICEAFTPGYWFNQGGGGGVSWADDWLGENPQEIQGVSDADGFGSVAEVQDYLEWDRSGGDGENGLSATGQLLRHYLALVLNVAFAGEECDLGSLEYDGHTVAEWLEKAYDALQTNADDDDKREIKDALDAINNSDAGDGTLSCGDTENTAHGGVSFELYDDADELVDSGVTDTDGSLVLDGDPDGTGLPLGTYTLVEVGNRAELECTIVSVEGEGATLNEEDGTVTIVLTEENADVTITIVNDCDEQNGEEDEFGHISVIKQTDEEEPAESFTFFATWHEGSFSLMDGDLHASGDLLAGEEYEISESLTDEQVAAGWSLDEIVCEGAETYSVSEDGLSVTVTLGVDEDVYCTFINELEEEDDGVGFVEIDKTFCSSNEGTRTEFDVKDPRPVFTARIQEHEGGQAPENGCAGGDASFTIYEADEEGEPTGDPVWTGSTGSDGSISDQLPDGEYVIVEDSTGESAWFEVADNMITIIDVTNFESGLVKVFKFNCDGDTDAVLFSIDGSAVTGFDPDSCVDADAAFQISGGDEFVTEDGVAIQPASVGTHTLTEIAPYQGTSAEFEVAFTPAGEIEPITVIRVYNVEGEEGEEEDTVTVSIMKHLCTDVTNVDQFEAVEEAGVPGLEGPLSGLVATVLACPTIVLTGDVPTSGAVTGGQVDFDFSVIDSSGTQVLSTDGDFMAAALCESNPAIDFDVNDDGDKADCLDTSHYTFEVVDGLVVVTETEDPANSSGLGTLRFTPGSGDDKALQTSIETVEDTGVIVLDTMDADLTAEAKADGIMLHVYNFAVAEGTQGGGGGSKPNEGTKGSQGAGQLPNTSTELGGSMPAILLAVTMLAGLGFGGYRMAEEARRRR